MKYKRKSIVVLCIVLISLVVLTGVYMRQRNANQKISNFVNEYYATLQNDGFDEAVNFCYFRPENSMEKEMYVANVGPILASYEIKKIDRINKDLYLIIINCTFSDSDSQLIYNYTINYDGKLRIVTNPRNIPDNLKQGFDEAHHAKNSDTLIDTDDIIW
ncbi:MAG: hypothetical protein HFF84_09200 [Oscillibacter sp.]|nr:hypothetical protein [Oscillibacter sp.]